jgi:hypothetical protein
MKVLDVETNNIYAYSSEKVNITIRKKKNCNIRLDDN